MDDGGGAVTTHYESPLTQMINRRRVRYGDKFDAERVRANKWARYYGQHVRVRIHGEVKVGRVSATTGWEPAFLLVREGAMGSSDILDDNARVITGSEPRPFILRTLNRAGKTVAMHHIWDDQAHYYRCLTVRRKQYPEPEFVHVLEVNPEHADWLLSGRSKVA